jgi:hypothetical protein
VESAIGLLPEWTDKRARKWTPNDDTAFKSRLSLLRRWADFCSARWIFLINASGQIDEVIHVEAGRFSHDSHRSF